MTTDSPLSFPAGFRWGAATAAYQVEGAVAEAGRVPSIWDTFTAQPGNVVNGDSAAVTVDHFHRFREDVALMARLGLTTYRFSVSWARALADGGLDFYERLVDELLAHEIEPMLTLYHWDHPQWLEDLGGWGSRDMASRFADYATTVGRVLGDRVPLWITLNEPWCTAFLGHASGVHAPGLKDGRLALTAAHHLNLAHGLGVQALRAALPESAQVCLALNPAPVRSDSPEAARRADALRNRLFLDPVLLAEYPADLIADTTAVTDWGFVRDDDLKIVAAPVDLLGVNYYTPLVVAEGPGPDDAYNPWVGSEGRLHVPPPAVPDGGEVTMHGAVDATGLYDLLMRLRRDYPPVPLVIAENGAAFPDHVGPDGRVDDPRRIAYLRAHLTELHRAIADGADVRGYIAWSLMDTFEWAYGYSQRFGLVHVDLDSGRRTIKSSGDWYREVIATNTVR
jgi:beta-glucosidase